ncbi:hypothetical protein QM583_08625 [Gordonia alkanivorans]|uniref:hypothetical protein n=1 Tax=Gordonia TaxID=2053 RepID=UPI0024B7CFFB|nr:MULTISPECIES: hypothetical protein [Gordonia]MDJ0027155.1 hypothetical protein [Gordonia alkanivorans]WJG11417.1 hypothetical protein PWF70_12235 [Gordonia sp. Swx-4]
MNANYDQLLIEWAHTYNTYERLVGDPGTLYELLAPLRHEFDRQGTVPEWAGIDLLRGWAFYLVRAHRHSGGYEPFMVEHPEVLAIADAIDKHSAVTAEDRPPARPDN